MAHIVCLTSGLTGILHASFALIARLEQAGHRLTCGSPLEVGSSARAQGIDYVQLPAIPVSPEPEVPSFSGPLRKWKRWAHKYRHRRQRQQVALENIGYGKIKVLYETLAPDLLIIDVELHEYIIAAHTGKWPLLLLSQWFSLWPSSGLPYLLHDTVPGSGWQGSKWAIDLSWGMVRLQRSWMFAKKKFLSLGTDRRSALLALADKLEFPRSYIKQNYWPGPFSYNTLPVLSMTAEEMEFPHDRPGHLHYIGPMVYAERRDTAVEDQLQSELAALFESRQERGLRLIYCSVSSLKSGDRRFLQKVCQAVQEEPSWLLMMSLGGLIDREQLGELPPNVYVYPWLPQLQILERADCSINHGGIHTINECIHFKVPMLVYSGKRSDQNGCAARVAYHQLGLIGDKDQDSVVQIREKIRKVLTDGEIRRNVELMYEHCCRYRDERCVEKLTSAALQKKKEIKATDGKPLV